jgi:hypothetical protein
MQDEIAAVVQEMRMYVDTQPHASVTRRIATWADRLSAASSSPGETQQLWSDIEAEAFDALVARAHSSASVNEQARRLTKNILAHVSKQAPASPHGPSSGEGQGGCR